MSLGYKVYDEGSDISLITIRGSPDRWPPSGESGARSPKGDATNDQSCPR